MAFQCQKNEFEQIRRVCMYEKQWKKSLITHYSVAYPEHPKTNKHFNLKPSISQLLQYNHKILHNDSYDALYLL